MFEVEASAAYLDMRVKVEVSEDGESFRVADVIAACRGAKLEVREDVSVLGIGNDVLVCERTKPHLSSIAVDYEEQGYCAARELHAMMLRKRKPNNAVIVSGAASVVARASTFRESPSAALARRALAFIAANAAKGIKPVDVVRNVRTSRRLLDLRFRETTGMSLMEAIRGYRLKAVKALLSGTDLPISIVAERCGYRDANYLKNQFRRIFGTTMRDWRALERIKNERRRK